MLRKSPKSSPEIKTIQKNSKGLKAISMFTLLTALAVTASCVPNNKFNSNPMEACVKAIQNKEFGEVPPANHMSTGGQPCACCHMN